MTQIPSTSHSYQYSVPSSCFDKTYTIGSEGRGLLSTWSDQSDGRLVARTGVYHGDDACVAGPAGDRCYYDLYGARRCYNRTSSPALCPKQYYTISSGIGVYGNRTATTGLCCPANYTKWSGLATSAPCAATSSELVVVVNSSSTTTTMMLQIADPFFAVAEASDYENWGLSTSETGVSISTFGISTSSSTPLSLSGSPIAAQAGIGVGVGGFVIALILAILVLRRRRSKKQVQPETDYAFSKAELPGDGLPRLEKDDTEGLQEADAESRRPEADASNVVAELETDWTGWEAPALLETDLSRDTAEPHRLAGDQPQQRSMMRNSIQQTPVEVTGGGQDRM